MTKPCKHEKMLKHRLSVLPCFVCLGGLSLFATLGFYRVFSFWFSQDLLEQSLVFRLLLVWAVNAPLEELSKICFFIVLSLFGKTIIKPQDGCWQGAAVGFGFGLGETILYGLSQGSDVFIIRLFVSVSGHIIYGALWGSVWGLEIFQNTQRKARLSHMSLAFIPAVFFHALFNTLCLLKTPFLFNILVDFCSLILSFFLFWTGRSFSLLQRTS